jgi:hypothetical protein
MTSQPQPGLCIPDPPRAAPAHLYLRRARAMFFAGMTLLASALVVGVIALVSLVEVCALERRRMLQRVCTELLSRASAYGYTPSELAGGSRELMEESRS